MTYFVCYFVCCIHVLFFCFLFFLVSVAWLLILRILIFVSLGQGSVASLQGDVTTLRTRLDPLVANVSRMSSQLSLVTPDAAQRLEHLNQLIASLQQSVRV